MERWAGVIVAGVLMLTTAAGAAPSAPAARDGCAGLRPQSLRALAGRSLGPGRYLLQLRHRTDLDAELVGGGGGGGSARARRQRPWGGPGHAAPFLPIFQLKHVAADRYLIEVGAGGEGGRGGNWSDAIADGAAGGDTRIARCSSGAVIARAGGGAGGSGDVVAPWDGPAPKGEDFTNTDTHVTIGRCGAGGAYDTDGQPGGPGAGGGGQGATERMHRYHGGRGGGGYARLSVAGGRR